MIRIFDFFIALIGLLLLIPVIIILLIIGFLDTGSPIFLQKRVGLHMKPFYLFKFRSMKKNTKNIATHLVDVSSITIWGSFLRKSKLDEVLQLINVLLGDMSFVGPRPNLFNQLDLIKERKKKQVYDVRPGITGLAQIKKIDMSSPVILAEIDAKMIQEFNIYNYFKYILLTIFGQGFGDRVNK